MKKKFLGFFAILGILVVSGFLPGLADAQTGDLFFGQDHTYSVIFRGNGEAVVYGKISFTNTGEEAISDFTVEFPKVQPKELMILQELNPVSNFPCPGYPNLPLSAPCPEYYSYDYSTGYQRFVNPTISYEKLDVTTSGTVAKMKLHEAVQPKQKGSLVMAYVATGYVNKSLGVYKFAFETPKVDSRINKLSVSVDVDSELVLKGKNSQVQYATSGLNQSFADLAPSPGAARYSSAEFTNVVNRIGGNGPVNKSAQNLSPNESLTVTGEYANSKLALNAQKLIIGVVVATLLLVGIVLLIIRWRRTHKVNVNQSVETANQSSVENSFKLIHPLYSSIGFASAAFIYGSVYVVQLFMKTGFYNYSYGAPSLVIPLMIILATFLVILGALVLPPVLISSKFGWRAGVSVIVNTFLSILIILAIFILLNVLGIWPAFRSSQPSYPLVY